MTHQNIKSSQYETIIKIRLALTVGVKSSPIAAWSLFGNGRCCIIDSSLSLCWIRRPHNSCNEATRFNTQTVSTSEPIATNIRLSLWPQVNADTAWRPCNNKEYKLNDYHIWHLTNPDSQMTANVWRKTKRHLTSVQMQKAEGRIETG